MAPHIVHTHLLAKAPPGRLLVDGDAVVGAVQIAHVADSGNSLGGEKFPQLQEIINLLSRLFCGQKRRQQIAGGLLEDAGGLPVFIPLDFAADGIRGVPADARERKRHAVDAADMGAGAHQADRRVAAGLIQVIAVWGTLFCQGLLIVSPALNPPAGALGLSPGADGLLQIPDGADFRRHDRDFFAEIRQHQRMHVGIHKARDHAFPF